MAIGIQQKIVCTTRDASIVSEAMRHGTLALQSERFDTDTYLNSIIEKPWGEEYRIYADNFYDVWKLRLAEGQSTSLHAHPRKETALLCLEGAGRITFLENQPTIIVQAGDFLTIGKGVCHATENIGNGDLELIEVETPRNKLDLVRVTDTYGRQGTYYERPSLDLIDHHPFLNLMDGSKIRTSCIRKRFRFALKYAAALSAEVQNSELLFLVSLDIFPALQHEIQIFSGTNWENMPLHLGNRYLAIHRSISRKD